MSIESLKRVLMKTKAEARSMRKGNLEARLNPKPKDPPVEGSPDEEAAESPAEMAAEAPPSDDAKAKRAKEISSIKKLLSRS